MESSDFGIINCLKNCSDHGSCQFSLLEYNFVCICEQYYYGLSCEYDSRACSTSPCLNNATCVDIPSNGSYTCLCSSFYTGNECETRIDNCKNVTCSNRGECLLNNREFENATCKCYNDYFGDYCQEETASLKLVKKAISASSIIAILTIICFYLLILISDISDIWCLRKSKKKKEKKKKHEKFIYINENKYIKQ